MHRPTHWTTHPLLVPAVGIEPTLTALSGRCLAVYKAAPKANISNAGLFYELTLACVVPLAGVEPARLSTTDFKSVVATNYTTGALKIMQAIIFLNGFVVSVRVQLNTQTTG